MGIPSAVTKSARLRLPHNSSLPSKGQHFTALATKSTFSVAMNWARPLSGFFAIVTIRSTASASVTFATGIPKRLADAIGVKLLPSINRTSPFAWSSHEKRLTCSTPRLTLAALSLSGSVSRLSSVAAIESTLSGSNVIATSAAISPSDPLLEHAHGMRRSIASTSERPNPSNRLGNT